MIPACIADWCGRRDSNPHILRYWYLKPARLPIPPRPLRAFGRDARHRALPRTPVRAARGYSRRIAEGKGLAWWHPLISGDPETVHAAGISVRGRTVAEDDVDIEDYEDYIVTWPLEVGQESVE